MDTQTKATLRASAEERYHAAVRKSLEDGTFDDIIWHDEEATKAGKDWATLEEHRIDLIKQEVSAYSADLQTLIKKIKAQEEETATVQELAAAEKEQRDAAAELARAEQAAANAATENAEKQQAALDKIYQLKVQYNGAVKNAGELDRSTGEGQLSYSKAILSARQSEVSSLISYINEIEMGKEADSAWAKAAIAAASARIALHRTGIAALNEEIAGIEAAIQAGKDEEAQLAAQKKAAEDYRDATAEIIKQAEQTTRQREIELELQKQGITGKQAEIELEAQLSRDEAALVLKEAGNSEAAIKNYNDRIAAINKLRDAKLGAMAIEEADTSPFEALEIIEKQKMAQYKIQASVP